jgi:hypothetical protein
MLCIDIWEYTFLKMVQSVDIQNLVFMHFFQQMKIAFHQAITALLKGYMAQSNQGLRYAMENQMVCIYCLQCPREVNKLLNGTANAEIDKFAQKLKEKGHKLVDSKFQNLSAIIKRYKKMCNTYGAHPSFGVAGLNTQVSGSGKSLDINFFDNFSDINLRLRLLIVSDVLLGACESTINLRIDPAMLPLDEKSSEIVKTFKEKIIVLRGKLDADRELYSDEFCYCGSGFKFIDCHKV